MTNTNGENEGSGAMHCSTAADWKVKSEKHAEPTLLPCPFCGGPAEVRAWNGFEKFSSDESYPFGVMFVVGCAQALSGPDLTCQIQPHTNGFLTPQLAADKWNTRFNSCR